MICEVCELKKDLFKKNIYFFFVCFIYLFSLAQSQSKVMLIGGQLCIPTVSY